ncbi:hypothetical protein Lesp02_12800 [Lentzea sp. NBRC 105346]|nr:hypothetical protein Lesp02_12800 [Lentzea sp. NBRC 105346]
MAGRGFDAALAYETSWRLRLGCSLEADWAAWPGHWREAPTARGLDAALGFETSRWLGIWLGRRRGHGWGAVVARRQVVDWSALAGSLGKRLAQGADWGWAKGLAGNLGSGLWLRALAEAIGCGAFA